MKIAVIIGSSKKVNQVTTAEGYTCLFNIHRKHNQLNLSGVIIVFK